MVYVSVGSNIDKERNFISCIKSLRETFGELAMSPVYESQAVGFEGDNFYNMVVSFKTEQSPHQIAKTLKIIERQHERVPSKNSFQSRTLDLDQILHGNLTINENGIQIPHNDIVKYTFVLRPLADLSNHAVHPVLGKTYAQLWSNLDHDALPLKKVPLKGI